MLHHTTKGAPSQQHGNAVVEQRDSAVSMHQQLDLAGFFDQPYGHLSDDVDDATVGAITRDGKA
jgi:hypothetical protein